MKTLLHVGCGHNRKAHTTPGFNTPEWQEIRLDIDQSVQPDILGSMTDMSVVEDKAIDAIFSSHNIEHLYPHEVPLALAEFVRVLQPDGFAVITCPDLQSVCALVADNKLTQTAYESPAGPIAPLDILYGHRPSLQQGKLYMAHRCGFTKDVLGHTLGYAGFQTVATIARAQRLDLWAFASKAVLTEAEVIHLVEAHGIFGEITLLYSNPQ